MNKSQSHEELSRSENSIFQRNQLVFNDNVSLARGFASSGTSLASTADYTTPSSSARSSPTLNERRILQLNEETNTWKISTKKKRKPHMRRGRKQIQSSWMKLRDYIKQENANELRFRITVVALFLVIIIVCLATKYYYNSLQIEIAIEKQIFVHKNARKITFLNSKGHDLLQLNYGRDIPSDIEPINCRMVSKHNSICLDWKYRAHLSVKLKRDTYETIDLVPMPISCYQFNWLSYEKYSPLKDCFSMDDSYWFGIGDIYKLKWPLNQMTLPLSAFLTSHRRNDSFSGSLIGRTFFISKGVSISIPLNVPLFISINSTDSPNEVCLISQKSKPYYLNNLHNYYSHLEYTVCLADHLPTLQNYFWEKNLRQNSNSGDLRQKPTPSKSNETQKTIRTEVTEEENMFLERIIWSTNEKVLPNFTQQTVQNYVNKITNYGMAGIVLFDSRWENSIGGLKMNEAIFNNSKTLVNILHNKGFKIMLTLSPNIAMRSHLVSNSSTYIFLDSSLRVPLLTRCSTNHEQTCALINFTDTSNGEHFQRTISRELVNQTGLAVDGVFMQGIQSSLIPGHANPDPSINPDQFIQQISSTVIGLPTKTGLSVSVSARNYNGYVTLASRESSWEDLQSIIPSVLSSGLLGYPLVNPNTVGGTQLFTKLKNETDYMNKELYLRWLQLVIFMPVVQFSEPPGGNDLDVIKIAKRLLKLRSETFVPVMKRSLGEFYVRGSPIIRPMWWLVNDSSAYTIDDQFFVGDDILVAPIVHEGKTERDVYLPDGWWKDEILAQVIRGGKWMRKYQIPLDKVAFFVRTQPSVPVN